jgi:hypothetical protein
MGLRWIRDTLLATAISTLIIALGMYFSAGMRLRERDAGWAGLGYSLYFSFVFGWPLAILTALLASTVAVEIESRQRRKLGAAGILVLGGIAGGMALPLFVYVMWRSASDLLLSVPLGMGAGLIGALVLWIGSRKAAQNC